jgi:hypothetical protein
MYKFIDKVYGRNECYKAKLDFGSSITPDREKTFFPSSWSQEKVIKTIFEASQNRIKDLSDPLSKTHRKYSCKTKKGLFIDIVIDNKNTIISAYPSSENFI